MNKKQIKEAIWLNLERDLEELERDLRALGLAIREKNAEKAGEIIPEIMRQTTETYTRLGVLGALDLLRVKNA